MVITTLTTTTSLSMCNHYALSNPVASLQAPAPEQISQGSALHGTGVPSNTFDPLPVSMDTTLSFHFLICLLLPKVLRIHFHYSTLLSHGFQGITCFVEQVPASLVRPFLSHLRNSTL